MTRAPLRAAVGCLLALAAAAPAGSEPAEEPKPEAGLFRQDYAFSEHWFVRNLPVWRRELLPLAGRPLHYLEVGVYEGMSALWMLENVLTHPQSRLTAVDVFPGDLEQRFRANLALSGQAGRTTTLKGFSQKLLKTLPEDAFDVIYIDGSHEMGDVVTDAVLSWRLLRVGGLLIFDDYRWSREYLPLEMRPTVALDLFVTAYRDELELVHRGYQLLVRKRPDPCDGEIYCASLGRYTFHWLERRLRAPDGSPVELSEAELALVEAIGRSRPFGRLRYRIPPELRAKPGFAELVARLGLAL